MHGARLKGLSRTHSLAMQQRRLSVGVEGWGSDTIHSIFSLHLQLQQSHVAIATVVPVVPATI